MHRYWERYAEFATIAWFDKRGTGSSGRLPAPPSLERCSGTREPKWSSMPSPGSSPAPAASAIGDDTRARHAEVPWSDVTRLRVVLAHHYHRVDAEQVWVIARDEVPTLVAALEVDHGQQAD